MIRVFSKGLNASAMLALQSSQYSERLLMADTVTAGQSKLGKTTVSNLGHFLCLMITGSFETLLLGGSGTIDDGINHLRGQLIDSTGNRKLFSDYVPLSLWLSPGRRRSPTAANAFQPDGAIITSPAANPLFYPLEFEYLFAANSDIQLDVKNDSTAACKYEIVFHGIRILSGAAVSGLRR